MRYRDQLKDARKWALIESGYSEELTPEQKAEAKKKAEELYNEAVAEFELIEQEEDEQYARFDRRSRNWDDAA